MHPIDTTKQMVLYEDKDMKVETIPPLPVCPAVFPPRLPSCCQRSARHTASRHVSSVRSRPVPTGLNAAHSTAAQAATIARDAHVGKLAIGHYSIRYDDETALLAEAQSIFPNTTEYDTYELHLWGNEDGLQELSDLIENLQNQQELAQAYQPT